MSSESVPSKHRDRCVSSRFEEVAADLAGVVGGTQQSNETMCQLDTRILVQHTPIDDAGERIRSRVSMSFAVMNPFRETLSLPPFRTTFNRDRDGLSKGELFSLVRYTVRSEDGTDVLWTAAAEDILRQYDSSTREVTYMLSSACEVPGCSVVQVEFVSERDIAFNDTYKYLVFHRPVFSMSLRYEFHKLHEAVGRLGVELRPKLTVISSTAKIAGRRGPSHVKTVQTWRLEGWLLVGNGIVLSW